MRSFDPRAALFPFVLLLVLLGGASAAVGAVLRVPEDYYTIQTAMDAAVPGDDILVSAGRYDGWFVRDGVASVVHLKSGVDIIAASGPWHTIIEGWGQHSIYGSDLEGEILVQGFRLESPYDYVDALAALRGSDNGATVRFENVRFAGWGTPDAGLDVQEANVRLEGCYFVAQHIGIYARESNVRVEECTFRSLGSGITTSDSDVRVLGCTFENVDLGIRIWNRLFRGPRSSLTVLDSRFMHSGAAVVGDPTRANGFLEMRRCELTELFGEGRAPIYLLGVEGTVADCVFRGNAGAVAGAIRAVDSSSTPRPLRILNNLFVGNRSEAEGAGALYCRSLAGQTEISGNTFVGNGVEDGIAGAVYLYGSENDVFRGNVVSEHAGPAPAVVAEDGLVSNCNVYWNNVGGNVDGFEMGAGSAIVDPEYCAPDSGVYTLSAGSPCVTASHGAGTCVELIGARGVGCAVANTRTHAILTSPIGRAVIVDQDSLVAPTFRHWTPGTLHELSVPEVQTEGEFQYVFAGWTDDPDRVRTVVAPDVSTPYTAQFDTFFRLTMAVEGGGTVTPATSWRSSGESVVITASPDSGWLFDGWEGEGDGSYTGPGDSVTVTMEAPLVQTARFIEQQVELTMIAGPGGSVHPPTSVRPRYSEVEIEATAGWGFTFGGWVGEGDGAYTGPENPTVVVLNEPIEQTALFENVPFALDMVAEAGGRVSPPTGEHLSFSSVPIEAIPDPRYAFARWKGQGDGAYSGPDANAVVTLNESLTQVAHFTPVAFEVSASLSSTDPDVHVGDPLGFGEVYLWLGCGSAGIRARALQISVTGDLQALAFLPESDVVTVGSAPLALYLPECAVGPKLLGRFLVAPPGEGGMCVLGSSPTQALSVTDCRGEKYRWPQDVRFTGVHTGGGSACTSGRGCEVESAPIDVGADAVRVVRIPEAPVRTRLASILPNPTSGHAEIVYELAVPGTVRLEVFDVAGRRVSELERGARTAGVHRVTWKGSTGRGVRVGPGVYFVRFVAGETRETRKVTLLE